MATQDPRLSRREHSTLIRMPGFSRRSFHRVSKSIYVLGAGKLGQSVAHALSSMGDAPPITLLSYRGDLVHEWGNQENVLSFPYADIPSSLIEKHDLGKTPYHTDECRSIIDRLVVTTNAKATITALLAVKDRLLPRSTVCFLQNGMGIIDQVNEKIFPNPAFRPSYMIGLPPQTIQSSQPAAMVDRIHGTTCISLIPKQTVSMTQPLVKRMYYGWTASSRSLMRSLTRCTLMKVKGFHYEQLLLMQLERLAVSAALEPLSVIFDCVNGQLFHNPVIKKLVRALLDEIATVIQSLPELQNVGNVRDQYTMRRLESLTMRLAARTSDSISPMLRDIRGGRGTEIDFINGYFVRRGLELGIPCPLNSAFVQVVKARQAMVRLELQKIIPFRDKT